MKLTRGTFPVSDVRFGDTTSWGNGTLTVNRDELSGILLAEPAIAGVDLALAAPGESARIIHVLDALPVMRKTSGPGHAFSGFFGLPATVESGRTHVLDGLAVLTCAEMPWQAGGPLIPCEGIIDMSGPGSHYSPFGALHNVVLELKLNGAYSDQEVDTSVRLAGLKAARYLGDCLETAVPPVVEHFEISSVNPDLPRIAYIHQIQSQGLSARSFVYGARADGILPTILHPNEMLDGAIVSSNYVYACYKTPTYLHCLAPVAMDLYSGHGVTHNFAGVILSRGHHYTYAEKVRSATYAAKLAGMLRCDGVIITWEGGGNSVIEAVETVQKCGQMGIRTTIIAYEFGNDQGASLLLDSVPEADAVISAGSTERSVH